MPRLAKGGKWVFGWSVVGDECTIRIPPEAYREYGFKAGMEVFFIRGSRTSGGFSVGRKEVLDSKDWLSGRVLASASLQKDQRLHMPEAADIKPGDRLLAVRGSGLALGFLRRGPIYELALQHPEIGVFQP